MMQNISIMQFTAAGMQFQYILYNC